MSFLKSDQSDMDRCDGIILLFLPTSAQIMTKVITLLRGPVGGEVGCRVTKKKQVTSFKKK